MRHYVLTRSAYGPAWDLDANRRRLAVTLGVTVASMAAQTNHQWQWIVALDRRDPLRAERRAAFESAGVPVSFIDVESDADRSRAAASAYRADWNAAIGDRSESVAMTRLDDDDAFAPWAMQRVHDSARLVSRRTALILPTGLRIWQGRCTLVRHQSNAMQTLVTPPGDTLHVYAYLHRDVRDVPNITVRQIHPGMMAWLWFRHEDTISGWRKADGPIHQKVKDQFPIDWSIVGQAQGYQRRTPGGRYFR